MGHIKEPKGVDFIINGKPLTKQQEALITNYIQAYKAKDSMKSKKPLIRIDKSLDKYENKVLFPEKVAKANEMLKNVGLPKLKK